MIRAAMPACLVLLSLAALAAGAGAPPPPLTLEDVVRMNVAGRPQGEILEEIRTREVDFDLSPEMLAELRLAGLSETLIDAMLARQAELDAAAARATAADEAPETVTEATVTPGAAVLRVVLEPRKPGLPPVEGAPGPLVHPPVLLHEALAREHGFDPDPARRPVGDLAVFLLCRTADHVPDHWRAASPLGRDYVLAPRHRVLAFHAGAERGELPAAGKLGGLGARLRGAKLPDEVLSLEVPAELSAELEPGVAHDLVIGIAALVGERWIVLIRGEREGVVPPAEGLELAAAVWSDLSPGGPALGAEFRSPAPGG